MEIVYDLRDQEKDEGLIFQVFSLDFNFILSCVFTPVSLRQLWVGKKNSFHLKLLHRRVNSMTSIKRKALRKLFESAYIFKGCGH